MPTIRLKTDPEFDALLAENTRLQEQLDKAADEIERLSKMLDQASEEIELLAQTVRKQAYQPKEQENDSLRKQLEQVREWAEAVVEWASEDGLPKFAWHEAGHALVAILDQPEQKP